MSPLTLSEPGSQDETFDFHDCDGTPILAAGRPPRDRSARAVQGMIALGEMTAGIAHDFRNILAVIESGLRLAEGYSDDVTKRASCFAAAQEGVAHGLKMTSRLLAFAQRQELEPGPRNVNALLRNLEMFLKYGAGPGVRVALELASKVPDCLIEPLQFNAAILNLVFNARDAMPEGGVIRIVTAGDCRRPGGDGAFVRVSVSDTGSGMPVEVSGRIFDPYFTTKGETGTGLGVPQVCKFMKSMRGFVNVESVVGAGTSFDLLFPPQGENPTTM